MTALVTGNSNSLDVFLYRCFYNFFNGSVMCQVNDFHTGSLKYPAHDIDGCVMAVKKCCCRDDSDGVLGLIYSGFVHSPSHTITVLTVSEMTLS